MRKINNPFIHLEGYYCFGCSPDNPNGLHMTFQEKEEEIISVWDPVPYFQGYHKVLHGGIQAALMDEIASWTVYVKVRTSGVTSKAEIRYRKTVNIDQGPLTLKARVAGIRRNLADISVRLLSANDDLLAEGVFTFFTFPEKKAKESLYYPEHEAFYLDQS